MSRISPEDRKQRPVNTSTAKNTEVHAPKGKDAGDMRLASRDAQADEADKAAEKKAKLAKTTGALPPDRTGLDTEESPAMGKGAERMREGRRARLAREEEGANEPVQEGAAGGKSPPDSAASIAEAQRLVIKNP